MASGLRKRHGAGLIACIRQALSDPGPPPPAIEPETPARVALLTAWAEAQAADTSIAAGLALGGPLLRAAAESGPAALMGWRREALGARLEALWRGRATVGLAGGKPVCLERSVLEPAEPPDYRLPGKEPA